MERINCNAFKLPLSLIICVALTALSCGSDPGDELADPLSLTFDPPSGYHGEVLTIKGTNFKGTHGLTSVSIGGISPATIVSMSSSEIVVSVPFGAKSGIITVSYRDDNANTVIHKSKNDFVVDASSPKFTGGVRTNGVAFSINGKGYMGTGFSYSYKKDFWEMDPATMVWTQKADFPGIERSNAFGFAINGKGYIGGGENNQPDDVVDFYEYDPSTNKWLAKASLTYEIAGPAAFVANNKGYIATGFDRYLDPINKVYQYDPALDSWTEKAAFPGTARMWASAFSINNKGYVAAGFDNYFTSTADDINVKDVWEYDPSSDSWTEKASFPGFGRVGSVGFSLTGKGYICNGFLGKNGAYTTAAHTNEVWSFDPAANAWNQKADFNGAPRSFAFAFTIGNSAYIGGGNDYFSYYDDVRTYQ
jgi:N-acetylneuraminic acid mutarotase